MIFSAKQKTGAITNNVAATRLLDPTTIAKLKKILEQDDFMKSLFKPPTKQNPGAITDNVASTVQLAHNSTEQLLQIATPAAPSDQAKEVATTSKPNPEPVTMNVAISAVDLAQ